DWTNLRLESQYQSSLRPEHGFRNAPILELSPSPEPHDLTTNPVRAPPTYNPPPPMSRSAGFDSGPGPTTFQRKQQEIRAHVQEKPPSRTQAKLRAKMLQPQSSKQKSMKEFVARAPLDKDKGKAKAIGFLESDTEED